MKRFLSWIVLYLMFVVENIVLFIVSRVATELLYELGKLGAVLRIILIIAGSGGALGIIGGVCFYGAMFACRLSQQVWRSRKGLRYYLLGGFYTLYYILALFLGITQHAAFSGNLLSFLMLAFCVLVIMMGNVFVSTDDPPPTKREILQAKIDKLDKTDK